MTPEFIKKLDEALTMDVFDPEAIKAFTAKYGAEYESVIYVAARMLHAIAPDLVQMIEARKDAYPGTWERDDGFIVIGNRLLGSLDDHNCESQNNKFATTAANRIDNIRKALEEGESHEGI